MNYSNWQKNRDGPNDFLRPYRENYEYRALVNQSIAPILEQYDGCVLDAGCGGGLISNILQKTGYDVLGIDKDKQLIMDARTKYPAVSFLEETLEDFIKCGWYKKFDFIISIDVINEVSNPMIFVDLMQFSKQFMVVVSQSDKFSREQLKALFKNFKVKNLDLELNKGTYTGLIIYAKKKSKKT